MTDALILFLGRAGGIDRWLRLADGKVAERGDDIDGVVPAPFSVAVVPGEEVALHWVELPTALAPAQANAAARILAADLSAQPIEDMHVAAGPDALGLRCVAITPAECMRDWLAACRAAGHDPALVLPEPLLILPREGRLVRFARDPLPLFRGETDAFSIEPELAAAALGTAQMEEIDRDALEADIGQAIDGPPVNLRQGAFARARGWKPGRGHARRLALLAAALLLATLAIQVATILRYTFAADRLETQAIAVAAQALPRGTAVTDPERQLERRLAEVQGAGGGFGMRATALFEAVKATPNAELGALSLDGGQMRATVVADTPATLTALQGRLEGQGLSVQLGAASIQNGRQAVEMIVGAR